MTDSKTPKVTVWLERHGYDMACDPREAKRLYVVRRIQNATKPAPGDDVHEDDVPALIEQGFTVNLS